MISKVISYALLLLLLFNVKLSSQADIVNGIESKCNDKCEPAEYSLYDKYGDKKFTATFQMESTDAFEPMLTLEMQDYQKYSADRSDLASAVRFIFNGAKYEFKIYKYISTKGLEKVDCETIITGDFLRSNCEMNKYKDSCKCSLKIDMDGLIGNEDRVIATALIKMINQQNSGGIILGGDVHWNMIEYYNLTDHPLYHWSYAQCCEYNKKVYDIDDGIITLKKDKDSFELFIYRFNNDQVRKPEKVTLVNSKNHEISISCDEKRKNIIVSTKTGMQDEPVLDKYIFRKHIDDLRCGISLSLEMESKYSSFSLNDSPLKLFYESDDSNRIVFIQEVKFDSDSDSIVSIEPQIESTTTPASVDEQVVDENQEHDAINPLIGVFLTVVTVVKSYFDLW